jgi:hypothetical protein
VTGALKVDSMIAFIIENSKVIMVFLLIGTIIGLASLVIGLPA